jgi:hypothetical protein
VRGAALRTHLDQQLGFTVLTPSDWPFYLVLTVLTQVITVPDECGTADALRHVAPRLTAPSVIVYSGDTVTDLHLPAVLLEHQVCVEGGGGEGGGGGGGGGVPMG